jgi:pilus assembly protein TadC
MAIYNRSLQPSDAPKFKVPFTLFPPLQAKKMSHFFFGFSVRLMGKMGFLEKWLYSVESDVSATEYLSMTTLNAVVYFAIFSMVAFPMAVKAALPNPAVWALSGGILAGLAVSAFSILYPKWIANKKVAQINRDLLFGARHLRVQTSAGVPLFDSLVSASHGYGAVSEEFRKIVTNVQSGANLGDAIEDSARRNPSYYYSRILWQTSNAVKAGTDIGPVLSEIVDFLAEEQRIEMRSYGAQLNTLAILYLMVCIIVPTVSLIFLMVISSFVSFPITDMVLLYILGAMIFIQYMFIGMIEGRRPAVSI